MLGINRYLLIALLFSTFASSGFSKQSYPQRRLRWSPDVSTALTALGILPDEIRSVLLLYSARNLSKSDANKLEVAVQKTPENIDDRLKLIGYYDWNGHTSLDRLRLRAHVLWMIENHPEHPAVAEPSLRDLRDDPEGNVQILALWEKNVPSCNAALSLLKNAEKFFFGKDPSAADQLIHCLSEKEPDNLQWSGELAQLYRLFGVPIHEIDDPAERALYAHKRVLELIRNPAARQALAGDMAEAAFKIGDFEGAAQLAKLHLQSSDQSAIQRADTILGLVALRSGDVASGTKYLLDSSMPEAAPYVSLYGPTMVLAKELLENGERDAVLQYLENCLSLWPRGENALQNWITEIQNGRVPNFGNLGL
jgi:tetratricopeptide (TPR) repeat protein